MATVSAPSFIKLYPVSGNRKPGSLRALAAFGLLLRLAR